MACCYQYSMGNGGTGSSMVACPHAMICHHWKGPFLAKGQLLQRVGIAGNRGIYRPIKQRSITRVVVGCCQTKLSIRFYWISQLWGLRWLCILHRLVKVHALEEAVDRQLVQIAAIRGLKGCDSLSKALHLLCHLCVSSIKLLIRVQEIAVFSFKLIELLLEVLGMFLFPLPERPL